MNQRKGADMKRSWKRVIIAVVIVVVVCAVLLTAHMLVNKVDLAGLLKSMHGMR
jgi:hypothetical protein